MDIWPLYLFLDRPLTINLGISLYAEATVEETRESQVILRSEDQGTEFRCDWDGIGHVSAPPSLELHLKLLRHFVGRKHPHTGLRISTIARSPAGAGLGGSSTLSVALIGALAQWSRDEGLGSVDPLKEGESLVEITRDIETTVIKVPAGIQDYYGAMWGGLQALKWSVARHEREWFPEKTLRGLEKRLLLFYSGQSRNSGINNWALFKAFIDRDIGVRSKFESIVDATKDLYAALKEEDWQAVGQAIDREWKTRRELAAGITTPEIDEAFATAMQAGASAGKICGAGGGGCFFVYLPSDDPALKNEIQKRIAGSGIRPLPFEAAPQGLEVQVSRAGD